MMAEKSADAPHEASTSQEDQASSNWWDSLVTSARTMSAEVYSMVKKDLDEIGTAVKSEASHVFSTTSTAIGKTLKLDEPESPANVMKKSLSSFIGQVSTALNPEPDDEDDTEVILSSGDTTMLSTYKKELEALQRVDATYLVPADGEQLAAWRAAREPAPPPPAAAARRLAAAAELRRAHRRLVPDAVSDHDFWERYLFRVALLQDRLAAAARRQPAAASSDPVLAHLPLQCATPVQQSPKKVLSGVEEDPCEETPEIVDVAWENEEFANDVELSEEQQTLLLEEYEREISSKKSKARDVTNNNNNDKTTSTGGARETKTAQTIDNVRQGRRQRKPDVCGNDIVEDYFEKEPATDDASANSDESWEKEFEIEDAKA